MPELAVTHDALVKRRQVLVLYLKQVVEAEDWHGVADAAMDLREIDAVLAHMAAERRARVA